jgi:hypothetical protein
MNCVPGSTIKRAMLLQERCGSRGPLIGESLEHEISHPRPGKQGRSCFSELSGKYSILTRPSPLDYVPGVSTVSQNERLRTSHIILRPARPPGNNVQHSRDYGRLFEAKANEFEDTYHTPNLMLQESRACDVQFDKLIPY